MTGWADVLALAERARLAEGLAPPPASAAPVLDRIAAVQDQLITELTLGRDEVARELASLRRGRGAVRGYRASAG